MKSPFINNDNTFYTSSDFAFALTYLAKNNKDEVNINDLTKIIRRFRIYLKFDNELLNKYLINANYTELKKEEINKLLDFIKLSEDFDFIINYEVFLHGINWNDETNELAFAMCLDQLYYYTDNRTFNSYESTFKYIFRDNSDFSFYKKNKKLEDEIEKINFDYYKEHVSDYFLDNNLLDVFEMMGIETFSDMCKINKNILYIIFSRNIDEYLDFFNTLAKRKKDNVADLLSLVEKIKECSFKKTKLKIIFYKRYGIGCERETLEQLGNAFGLTRERIRQQEKKTVDYIKTYFRKKFIYILHEAIKKQKIKKDFLDMNEVKSFIDNDELSDLLRALIEILCEDIKYDKKFDVLYYTQKENTMFDNVLSIMPYYVKVDELKDYKGIQFKLITDSWYYRKVKDLGFVKSTIGIRDLYRMIVDELYPNGFKIDDRFVSEVNNALNEKYGIELKSDRVLHALVNKDNYCLIDRGTFISRKLIAPIPEILKEKIMYYLSQYELSTIYYSTIYSVFEKELNEIGVLNKYCLKGLIDIELPEEYTPHKDYILLTGNSKTAIDSINEVISKMDGLIDMGYLHSIFPGVKDYTFVNQFYQRDDILRVSIGNQFVKIDYSKINPTFENVLRSELKNLFDSLQYPVVTSSKLFSRIKIFYPNLLDNNYHIDNQFALFSYLEKRIHKYFYKRPFISREKPDDLNGVSIISNYVDSLDYFNSKVVDSFRSKMHLKNYSSYLDFMIEKSDKFIQIDESNCIKKEKLRISNNEIIKIQNDLDYYINSFGPVDSRRFINFDGFPYVGYNWTKYLLVGIVRGFLNEQYIIEYTSSNNTRTEFIIRRA